jgi:hypothetical protein
MRTTMQWLSSSLLRRVIDEYNVDEYNGAIDEYNVDVNHSVDEHNGAIDEYNVDVNHSVDEHNGAIDEYNVNRAVDEHNGVYNGADHFDVIFLIVFWPARHHWCDCTSSFLCSDWFVVFFRSLFNDDISR